MKTQFTRFGEITKSEQQPDGTCKVWGYASTEEEDSQGEIVTRSAMADALPEYMKFANIREMHQPKAAGICIEANVGEDGRTFFGAHIIDKEAAIKVREGVYKGFSIGGSVLPGGRDTDNPKLIKGLRLVEVSLVDRPANPGAIFNFFKADGLTDEMKKGMSHVSQLAYMLKEMQYLVADQQNEAAREGDASTVPAQLSGALKNLGDILVQMVQEETAELTSRLDEQAAQAVAMANSTDSVMWADKIGEAEAALAKVKAEAEAAGKAAPEPVAATKPETDPPVAKKEETPLKADPVAKIAETEIEKKGAKFSSATVSMLTKAQQAMKDACGHLDGLGYQKADDGTDVAKALDESLVKMMAERDLLKTALVTLTAERDELAKKWNALPRSPGKGVLRVVPVEKAADVIADAKPAPTEEQLKDPVFLVKSIHAGKGKSYVNAVFTGTQDKGAA